MKEPNLLAGSESLSMLTAIEAIIKRSCIIDYGIVQAVRGSGVVDVSVAVTDTEQNMFVMTCVLANIASEAFTIDVTPSVGDRVLVVYPRIYDDDMFTVPSGEDKKKLIVNKNAKGYNLMCGIAILLNQYKKSSHKRVVKIDGDTVKYSVDSNYVTVDLHDTSQNKIHISDSNGCSYETSSEGTVINGKLKIKV